MSDRDALLAAILAQPDEDMPRLVYADWLDENGASERAEFIRVQCRLPHLSPRTAEARRLIAREDELRAKLFPHLHKTPFAKITFRRGFVETVTSGLRVFGNRADKLRVEDAPAFEMVLERDEVEQERFDDDKFQRAAFLAIADRPELRRCTSLSVPHLDYEQGAELFLKSPNLTGLRRFTADRGRLEQVFDGFNSPTFSNLRVLNLSHNDDTDNFPPDIEGIVASRHLVNLEHLDLSECSLWDGNLKSLTTTKQLPRLRSLNLSEGRFGIGLADFFRANSLPALTELDLSDSLGWWGEAASEVNEYVRVLADSPRIEQLTKLALRRNQIADEGALALAASPRKLQLTHLDLWCNQISTSAKRALEKRFGHGVCTYRQPKQS